MLSTDFVTGSPNWIDLGSPDLPATAAFYRAVLGWEFAPMGPEGPADGDGGESGYGFFRKDGKTVAALGLLTEEGAVPAWMVYFDTRDIEGTTAAVRAAGGEVRVEPGDVMGEGMLAQYTDPDGAQFAVWQPARTAGLELTSADGSLVWVELMSGDPERSIAFYRGLFGWRSQDMEMGGGMTYRVLSTAEGDLEDATFGGVAPAEAAGEETADRWVPYFAVADADDTVARARAAGGSVVMPATSLDGVGRMAWLADPAGAVFAVLKPEPRQR
ncbi:VOC family protein [Streptomyces sp. NPDC097619]|uniref:VOC family protein n=1 Tax=Streptomyces sp. NPDC097619 TaxID=3157228 RepID=UPI0033221CF7